MTEPRLTFGAVALCRHCGGRGTEHAYHRDGGIDGEPLRHIACSHRCRHCLGRGVVALMRNAPDEADRPVRDRQS